MNYLIRITVVAVVVVGVGLAAVNLLPSSNGGVGGAPPTLAPTPSPTPTPRALTVIDHPVPIDAGTYVTVDPFPLRFTATVPSGWTGNVGGPYAVWLDRADGQGGVGSRSSTRSTLIRATSPRAS